MTSLTPNQDEWCVVRGAIYNIANRVTWRQLE